MRRRFQPINEDAIETVGWPTFTATVAAAAWNRLPPARERANAVVLTSNYGEAGAIARYGPALGLPRSYSGHNAFWRFGRPLDGAEPDHPRRATADPQAVARSFEGCRLVARIDNGVDLDNEEQGRAIWTCATTVEPWSSSGPACDTSTREPRRPLDLPGALPEHGDALTGFRDAVDVELRAADHEVDVNLALVHALPLGLVGHLVGEAVAERDVARSVLVEERVEEDRLQRPDPSAPVDERELAEPPGPSSLATAVRRVSAFSSASIPVTRPPANSTRSPRMIVP